MTIKIIKQSEANMWYNAHVGEQYEVDERKTTDEYYVVKETFLRWVRHVYKGDCEILHEQKSNNDVQPQLNKPDVMRWLDIEKQKPDDFQMIIYKTKDGRVGEGDYRGSDWVKVGDEAFPFAWWVPQPTIA